MPLSIICFQHPFFYKFISMIVYSFPSMLDFVFYINLMLQEWCFIFFSPVRRKGALFYVCIHRSLTVFPLPHWGMGRIILYSLGLKSNFLFEVEVENWFLLYSALWYSCAMLLNTFPGCGSTEDSLLTISCLPLGGIDIHRHYPILSPQEVCTARNAFS